MTSFIPRLRTVLGVVVALSMLTVAQLRAEPIESDPLGTPVPKVDEKVKEVTDAAELFKKLDFNGALKLLKEAAKKNADLPPAQVILAQWFAQAQQAAGVRASLEQAIVEEPDDPTAYLILGDTALRERRVIEAQLLLEKANSLMANFTKSPERKKLMEPRVAAGLAAVAESREDWAGAQKQIETWLKAEPKSADALQRMGRTLFKQGKAEEAWAQLKAAGVADPKIFTPSATLSLLYEQAGDHDNAKKWMEFALKSAPKDLRTQLVAAQWSLETGQPDQAKDQATAALQIDPKSLDAKVLRGVVALFQKDWKNAEMYFESALMQSPNNFAAKNNLALALCEQSDDAKKQLAYEHAVANYKLYPKNAEALSTYGWVLYKAGNVKEAYEALRQAAAGGISADTGYYIAQVAADLAKLAADGGQADAAKQLKEQAKKLLDSALQSKRPFSKRQEADALLKQLGT